MLPLVPIALTLFPGLLRLIEGGDETVPSDIENLVKSVASVTTPDELKAKLDDPAQQKMITERLAQFALAEGEKQKAARDAAERLAAQQAQAEEAFRAAEFQRQMQELQVRLADVKDARANWQAMASQNARGWWINPLLSILITAGFLGTIFLLMYGPRINNSEAFNIVLGALGTAFATIIGFHFGSSAGSKEKDKALINQRFEPPPPDPPAGPGRPVSPGGPADPGQGQAGTGAAGGGAQPGAPKVTPAPSGPFALFDEKAPGIMRDLVRDFGLQPHQAAGILGNIGHECGGFRMLQEVKPVAGGRGGWGWCQWTGPRRRAFEANATAKKLDFASDEANYDFLKEELNGPESAALPALKRTQTLEDATQVFMAKFERPGIEHLAGRLNWARRALGLFG